MGAPIHLKELDLSPSGLFPDNVGAADDEKCLIISKLFQEAVAFSETPLNTQYILERNAVYCYKFLSKKTNIPPSHANHGGSYLHQLGVSAETIKKYYSYRLSEEDGEEMQIPLQEADPPLPHSQFTGV